MSILGRISGSLPFRGQRGGAPAPAPASDKPKPPPPPIQRPAGKPASTPASDKKGPPPGPPPIQRPASKTASTPSEGKPKPPPPPIQRTKPTGPPPAIPTTSQADKDKAGIERKIANERMAGDQHRTNGAHASADYRYRRADEMESRLKQGAPQLDENTMQTIRPSQHLRDNPGSGWGRY